MLLIVCIVKFVTLVFSLPHSPPSLCISDSPATELNIFCCAFVCKPGIARGGGGVGGGDENSCRYTQRGDPEHKLYHLIMAESTPAHQDNLC